MSAAPQSPAPGAYKFTVRSAEHAVAAEAVARVLAAHGLQADAAGPE
jgi:hypothetical protein